MRRVAILMLSACTLPWAITMALSACTDDAQLAFQLSRAGIGPVALGGPCLMFLVLSDAGKLEAHRALTVIAALIALASMGVTWSTTLVVSGVRPVLGGFYYTAAGPLNALHVGQIALWS